MVTHDRGGRAWQQLPPQKVWRNTMSSQIYDTIYYNIIIMLVVIVTVFEHTIEALHIRAYD